MLGFVVFVIGVLVVGGLLFLLASVLLGRGETQPPAELDRSPVELPDDRPVVGDDIRSLRMSVALRGYRMTEVDWLLDQFALILDEREAEIDALRSQLQPPADEAGDEARDDPRDEARDDPGDDANNDADDDVINDAGDAVGDEADTPDLGEPGDEENPRA